MKGVHIFNRILHRGEKISPDLRNALLVATVQGTGQGVETTDARMENATNIEMLHDYDIQAMLNDAMYDRVFVQDDGGQWKQTEALELNYDIAALRMLWSHVNRATFLTQKEADIIKIKLRYIMRCIKIQSNPAQYNLSFSNWLKAIEIDIRFMLNDAIDGRKARLLKTSPKVTTLSVEGQGVSARNNP